MLQIGDKDRQYVIDTESRDITPLKEVLENNKIVKVFTMLSSTTSSSRSGLEYRWKKIYDTFLVERVLHCGKQDHGYSLSKCCERYLGVTLDKTVRNKFIGLTGQPYTVDQITYGANDVVYLIDIREKQLAITSCELHWKLPVSRMKVVKVFQRLSTKD